jgi:hypothetical protein
MNQTAVEWMYQQLWDIPRDKFFWQVVLKKAKEMEKDQMINSYLAGKWDEKFTDRKSEEFYEQTYGDK